MTAASVNPVHAVTYLGKAVHVRSARYALSLALGPPEAWPDVITYGTACSGIDTCAVALESLASGAWRYLFASELPSPSEPERLSKTAEVLLAANAIYGLTRAAIHADACSLAATVHAPPVHLWVITPPCEEYSRRNHSRSAGGMDTAAFNLDRMLVYARIHRPRAIILENVDEPQSRSSLVASILSVRDYAWRSFDGDATDYGPMARKRRFYVGTRRY
jgi:hypothetical protein